MRVNELDTLKLDEYRFMDFGVFQLKIQKRRGDYMGILFTDYVSTGRWECRKNVDELVGAV